MEFKEVIESRYSCKKYSDKKVEREKLEAVLEAGRLAPTARNLQEQHVYVLESREALDKFDIETPCRYGAPTVLVVAFDTTNQGLNSCWINGLDPEKLHKALGLPENEEILMAMDLGYAAEEGTPLPNHFKRKALSETISYL